MSHFKDQFFNSINIASICLWLTLAINFNSSAQENHYIDSLRIAYDYSEDSYERIKTQLKIGDYYYQNRSIDTAVFELKKAVSIIPNDSLELKAYALNRLSSAYRKIEDMDNKLMTHKAALDLYQQSGNQAEIAHSLARVGRDYYDEAIYDTAMTYYMDAKEVYESNQIFNENYGSLLHYIGSVFKRQGDDAMACEYYNKEISFGREYSFPTIEAEGLYLASICLEAEDALKNYFFSLSIYKENGSDKMIPLMYTLISGAYDELGKIDSSLHYQEKCLELYRVNKEIGHLASALSNIAWIYIELGRYGDAEIALKEAEEIALRVGVKRFIRYKDIYHTYYYLYYEKGSYQRAVEYQSLYYSYKDSARAEEHQDAILEMEKIYNDEKSKSDLAIKEKEVKLEQLESKRLRDEKESETFIKYISFMAFGLVLVLGVFVYVKYRESQKQKIMISAQKREMEFQKNLVEQKNKDITDSMIYASSIQKAIITSEDYLSTMFSDSFIFYKPRDIVSGDFYWAHNTEKGKRLLAVGDCTGHGVPGAMMSMLGSAFLNEIVVEGNFHDPAVILNKLRDQVKRALQEEGRTDGMDMSIICIQENKLTFSGANLPMYLLRKGVLKEIKGNKQPVGHFPMEEIPFTNHEVDILKDDQVYLFSDGYADQFGGDKGKKYKYKTFREKIITVSGMSLKQQRSIIVDEFETWKGDLEQLDDVCVVGVRV